MMTEAFVAAHTEVLRQLLQAQQRMAQQLPQMPPMQQEIQPSEPSSPEVPTHCRRNSTVRRAKFYAEPDGVRYHPRTLWETISE
jgi:hypothetical protein